MVNRAATDYKKKFCGTKEKPEKANLNKCTRIVTGNRAIQSQSPPDCGSKPNAAEGVAGNPHCYPLAKVIC